MPATSVSQLAYRGRNDDAGEIRASWKAAQSTAFIAKIGETFRLRLLLGTLGDDTDAAYKLQFRVNGGGWGDCSGVSALAIGDSFFESDGPDSERIVSEDATTAQMTLTGYTFIPGHIESGDAVTPILPIVAEEAAEVEWTLQLVTAAAGDVFEVRAVESDGTVLNSYVLAPITADAYGPQFEGEIAVAAKYTGDVEVNPKYSGEVSVE
jgi:hypothetical protein